MLNSEVILLKYIVLYNGGKQNIIKSLFTFSPIINCEYVLGYLLTFMPQLSQSYPSNGALL